jgi:hypothetical protein
MSFFRFIHSRLITLSRATVDVEVFKKVYGFALKPGFSSPGITCPASDHQTAILISAFCAELNLHIFSV